MKICYFLIAAILNSITALSFGLKTLTAKIQEVTNLRLDEVAYNNSYLLIMSIKTNIRLRYEMELPNFNNNGEKLLCGPYFDVVSAKFLNNGYDIGVTFKEKAHNLFLRIYILKISNKFSEDKIHQLKPNEIYKLKLYRKWQLKITYLTERIAESELIKGMPALISCKAFGGFPHKYVEFYGIEKLNVTNRTLDRMNNILTISFIPQLSDYGETIGCKVGADRFTTRLRVYYPRKKLIVIPNLRREIEIHNFYFCSFAGKFTASFARWNFIKGPPGWERYLKILNGNVLHAFDAPQSENFWEFSCEEAVEKDKLKFTLPSKSLKFKFSIKSRSATTSKGFSQKVSQGGRLFTSTLNPKIFKSSKKSTKSGREFSIRKGFICYFIFISVLLAGIITLIFSLVAYKTYNKRVASSTEENSRKINTIEDVIFSPPGRRKLSEITKPMKDLKFDLETIVEERSDSSIQYFLFFITMFGQIAVIAIQCIGISWLGSCGWLNGLEAFAINRTTGSIMLFIAIMYSILLIGHLVVLSKVHNLYRNSGMIQSSVEMDNDEAMSTESLRDIATISQKTSSGYAMNGPKARK